MLTILFDGVAYGMLLFILAVGLSVTMGLMNFINLAHGAFAMAGGYIAVLLMQRFNVPFLVCLPLAFCRLLHGHMKELSTTSRMSLRTGRRGIYGSSSFLQKPCRHGLSVILPTRDILPLAAG